MSDKKPNTYPSEFKESAVKLAIESDCQPPRILTPLGANLIDPSG
ncbi:hypothetical protein [Candidatus Paracaedibacter symbiosus]|nr:hypothetical protein [Candidatus Paracaedibacter symbiosus]